MHGIYPGKEQPYPPQTTRYLDPVLLWTVAATATGLTRPALLSNGRPRSHVYAPPTLAELARFCRGWRAGPAWW
jgi:hypothetical protein